jgi:hypothetical protein
MPRDTGSRQVADVIEVEYAADKQFYYDLHC